MIIVAWNGSGNPSAIFNGDVFKKVLSVFITAAILKLGQEAIKPLVEVDPSIKKAVESIFGVGEASYEALPIWFKAMCHNEPSAVFKALYLQKLVVNIGYSRIVHEYETRYQRLHELAGNIQVSCFDRQNEVFEVRECPSGVEYAVDLRQQRCDCRKFQVDRLLCRNTNQIVISLIINCLVALLNLTHRNTTWISALYDPPGIITPTRVNRKSASGTTRGSALARSRIR
ncbi:hypothetical protein Ahy_B01g056880 [Arachis hypogaea]|uniref:SWIM-type domain-containing protein n=1 Tax=Arachis hypogaea TaxID=3818 RepID=A0A445AZR7_ARAHY|nr:hypothetical protein Ahy_B01g056880 [Arachis hypogaea]